MTGANMELEDYYNQAKAELAVQREQIDNLVAVVVARDKRIAELEEQMQRMTSVLDDVLGVARRRELAAKADIARQEQEAGL
jgi:CHASE3 domain sensor protein